MSHYFGGRTAVIISHRNKFVFIKTHKTAGTSVEIALSRVCGENDIITPFESLEDERIRKEIASKGAQNYKVPFRKYTMKDWARLVIKRKRASFYNHIPAYEVKKRIERSRWASYFKFCFERNPWDKTLSYWHFQYAGVPNGPSLSEFIMSDELYDVSDWSLYTRNGKVIVDYVARYESIDQELQHIFSELGVTSLGRLPQAKGAFRKDHRPYWEVLSSNQRRRIENVFSNEIHHWGYTFGHEIL
jgi:Sulfotransferase family